MQFRHTRSTPRARHGDMGAEFALLGVFNKRSKPRTHFGGQRRQERRRPGRNRQHARAAEHFKPFQKDSERGDGNSIERLSDATHTIVRDLAEE